MASRELLDLIIEAMKDEKHDREKYCRMINMTEDAAIRRQIRFGYEDEGKHYLLFKNLYYQLTGKNTFVATPEVDLAKTLLGNVKTSIDGELAAVEMYHRIYSLLAKRSQRDMVLGIIQDEQEHATRFVYLFAKLT